MTVTESKSSNIYKLVSYDIPSSLESFRFTISRKDISKSIVYSLMIDEYAIEKGRKIPTA